MIVTAAVVAKFDEALSRGLCKGTGSPDRRMCILSATCYALGQPHGDKPEGVEPVIRNYEMKLNDSNWSSASARAAGLRDLGIAQLGSNGVVSGAEFNRIMTRKTIQFVIPGLFRDVFKDYGDPDCMTAADLCEKEGTVEAADSAAFAARTYYYKISLYSPETGPTPTYPKDAAYACAWESSRYNPGEAAYHSGIYEDKYLRICAKLALDTLRELKSKGCEWLDRGAV